MSDDFSSTEGESCCTKAKQSKLSNLSIFEDIGYRSRCSHLHLHCTRHLSDTRSSSLDWLLYCAPAVTLDEGIDHPSQLLDLINEVSHRRQADDAGFREQRVSIHPWIGI